MIKVLPAILAFWLGVLMLCGIATRVGAQATLGGTSLRIPTSVRSEGMGRAYAPLERGAQAAWANPGALALITGLDAAFMNTQLILDLADDVLFNNQSIVFGVGIDFGDVPLIANAGFNRTYLDYGESIATSPDSPDPIGTFNSWEEVWGWTVALGVADLVGVGVGVKYLEVDLAGELIGDDGRFGTTAYDIGIYGRTPAIPFRKKGEPEPVWGALLAGGIAWLNSGGDLENKGGSPQSAPLPRNRRESLALEIDVLPMRNQFSTENRWLARLIRDKHVLSLVGTIGRRKNLVDLGGEVPDTIASPRTEYYGLEIRVFDSLAFRYGYIDDEVDQVIGNTYGLGISVLGLVGVDWAEIPQFGELARVQKWSFWLKIPLDARL